MNSTRRSYETILTPPLGSPSRGDCCLESADIILQSFVTVLCVWDIVPCQNHEVIVTSTKVTNFLWEAEAADIWNTIRPQVEPCGGRTVGAALAVAPSEGGHHHVVSIR